MGIRDTSTLVRPATTAPTWSTHPSGSEIQHTTNPIHTPPPGFTQDGMCPNARHRGLGGHTEVRYCVRVAQRPTPGR